jgi:hypothetical protein
MQKDKKLDEVLKQHAIEETSADFTANVMNKVAALQTSKHYILSPFKSGAAKFFIGVFVFVCITLLAASVVHPFASFIKINIQTPSYTTQLIYFFIAFWVVMLANLWWRQRTDFAA